MESVLHSIEELQRLVEELVVVGSSLSRETYEVETEQFLERIETFVVSTGVENEDYLLGKLMEIGSYIRYLLRPSNEEADLARYQALAHNALNVVYRNIKSPVRGEYEEAAE